MPDKNAASLRRLVKPLRVTPGSRVVVPRDFDPAHTASFVSQAAAAQQLRNGVELLAEYQARLAAQDTYALLVVLQGLDSAGKDGVVKHVMSGVNPAGVHVRSFKVPSAEELSHDYLWRYAQSLPERGAITIFNRSHYEEVLVVRVHADLLKRQQLPAARSSLTWTRRFDEINQWERYLTANGIRVIKLFLNISRDEQRRRFLKRIEEPEKNWKFSINDIQERRHWDEYQRAYSAALSHTSTAWAPWYVVPSDHKWFARLVVAAAVLDALIAIDPHYPRVTAEKQKELQRAYEELTSKA